MLKLRKYPRGGFTLIELLVVVLIIGILAAIALPQYRFAIAKSKFATLKDNVKALYDAETRYYLVNDRFTTNKEELDVKTSAWCSTQEPITGETIVRCYVYIGGHLVSYIIWLKSNGKDCYTTEEDKNGITHSLCKSESGLSDTNNCFDNICHYQWK